MTLKNDEKTEKEQTYRFQTGIRTLTNFRSSNRKSQNLHFYGLLLTKVYNVRDKKYRGVIFYDTREQCKV